MKIKQKTHIKIQVECTNTEANTLAKATNRANIKECYPAWCDKDSDFFNVNIQYIKAKIKKRGSRVPMYLKNALDILQRLFDHIRDEKFKGMYVTVNFR